MKKNVTILAVSILTISVLALLLISFNLSQQKSVIQSNSITNTDLKKITSNSGTISSGSSGSSGSSSSGSGSSGGGSSGGSGSSNGGGGGSSSSSITPLSSTGSGTLETLEAGTGGDVPIPYLNTPSGLPYILLYHGIVSGTPAFIEDITLSDFQTQMQWLHDNGYTTVTLKDYFLTHNKQLSDKEVILMFDDGYSNFRTNALPVLQSHGFTATVSVVTSWTGIYPYMSWDDISYCYTNGIEIASHSVDHADLLTLTPQMISDEIVNSKSAIEAHSVPVYNFIYPYGKTNSAIETVVKNAGYIGAREVGGLSYNGALPAAHICSNTNYSICSFVIQNNIQFSNFIETQYRQEFGETWEAMSNAVGGIRNFNSGPDDLEFDTAPGYVTQKFSVVSPGIYRIVFRVKTGGAGLSTGIENAYTYTIDGVQYKVSLGNIVTSGPFVDDLYDSTWGFQTTSDITLSGGQHTLRVDTSGQWEVLDYFIVQRQGEPAVYNLEINSPTTQNPILNVTGGQTVPVTFDFLEDSIPLTSGVTLNDITIGGQPASVVEISSCSGNLDCSVYNEGNCNSCSQCNWTEGSIGDDWQMIGSVTGSVAGGTGSQSVTLPAGLQQGDIIIVALACDSSLSSDGISNGQGYTDIVHDSSSSPGANIAWKVMGASPDSQVSIERVREFFTSYDTAYVIQAWRGVNVNDVLDVAATSVTGSSGDPDSPSITPVTPGALVFTIGLGDDDGGTVNTVPSGYSNPSQARTGTGESDRATAVIASKMWSSGAEDPAAWVLDSFNDNWRAWTVALRPIVIPGSCNAISGGSCSFCPIGECNTNCAAAGCSIISTPQFSYIPGTGWKADVTTPSGLTGLKDLFVSATYSGISRSQTQISAVNYGGECTIDADCPDYNLFCTGGKTCSNGACVQGIPPVVNDNLFCTNDYCNEETDVVEHTPVSCSAFDLPIINICTNSPDDNPLTFDFRTAFTSTCSEGIDSYICTTGADLPITHTCDFTTCGAQCDSTHSCADTECNSLDKCYDGNHYWDYSDVDNNCLAGCTCEANACETPVITTCSDSNRWYNTTNFQWVSTGTCTEKQQVQQEYRSYSCASGGCTAYSIINTQWVDTGTTRNKADGLSCSDGFFCNGAETCQSGVCSAGTLPCLAYNIPGIETCNNDPDSIPTTWDFRAAFTSVCIEANPGYCTTRDSTITHTCDVSKTCGAQCDSTHSCAGDTTCNMNTCLCEDAVEYYQENADSYRDGRAEWWDGNWSTNSGGNKVGYMTYTKPADAFNTSTLRVKDSTGTYNLAIPSSCWNYYPDKLAFKLTSGSIGITAVYCEKSSGSWLKMQDTKGRNGFYEEAMVWRLKPL